MVTSGRSRHARGGPAILLKRKVIDTQSYTANMIVKVGPAMRAPAYSVFSAVTGSVFISLTACQLMEASATAVSATAAVRYIHSEFPMR